jgi:hypothetical protein
MIYCGEILHEFLAIREIILPEIGLAENKNKKAGKLRKKVTKGKSNRLFWQENPTVK